MRLLALVLPAFLIACATRSPVHLQMTYLQRAESAVAEKNWMVAYRSLEDGLVSANFATKDRALGIYRSHPELEQSALQSFSPEMLEKTLKGNGCATGAAIERNRLRMYAVIATDEKLKFAADNLQIVVDACYSNELAEQARKDAELLAFQVEFEMSKAEAIYRCRDQIQCQKAFALTQIFIVANSDMKIQMANDTIIDTFNPNKDGAMGASAMKIPREGSSAEIRLSVSCRAEKSREMIDICKRESIRLNRAFPKFLLERLAD